MKNLTAHDEYCEHWLLEEERQKEALRKHYQREKARSVMTPNQRALLFVGIIFVLGVAVVSAFFLTARFGQ